MEKELENELYRPIKTELLDVNVLKPHPLNKIYFDDIEGQAWLDFIESVETSGIIEPLIVTKSYKPEPPKEDETAQITELTEEELKNCYIVVAGHQRLRAAKELGLSKVPCEVHEYVDKNGISANDWILKELIETNIRQRGKGNLNDMKSARCLLKLYEIYGIRRGGYRGDLQNLGGQSAIISESQTKKYQKYLADMLGISERQLRNLYRLNNLIPEIQQLVEEGKFNTTDAAQFALLNEELQSKLYHVLGDDINKLTAEQIRKIKEEAERDQQALLAQINELEKAYKAKELELKNKENEINQKENLIKQYETAIELNKKRLKELENKTVEKIEIIPDSIKQELEKLKRTQAETEERFKETYNELLSLRREYEKLKNSKIEIKDDRKIKNTIKLLDEVHLKLMEIDPNDIKECNPETLEDFKETLLKVSETIENILMYNLR